MELPEKIENSAPSESGSHPIVIVRRRRKKMNSQQPNKEIEHIALSQLHPDPEQPRRYFAPDQLKELKESIEANGILNPLLYRFEDGKKIIVSGERRYRAAKEINLEEVPAFLVTGKHQITALTDNMQHCSLLPMEEARAANKIINDYSITQEELGKKLGKAQNTMSELLKLCHLPDEIQNEAMRSPFWSKNRLLKLAKISDPTKQLAEFEKFKQMHEKNINSNLKDLSHDKPTDQIDENASVSVESPSPKANKRVTRLKSYASNMMSKISKEAEKPLDEDTRKGIEEEFKALIDAIKKLLHQPMA